MKRRTLLEGVATGLGLAGYTPGDGDHVPSVEGVTSREDASSRGGQRAPATPDDDWRSLRTIARWMDPDRPAERLYGNGPPFDADRPAPYDVSDLVFHYATVDVDDEFGPINSPDPPETRVVSGPVDLEAIEAKVTHHGIRYLDAPPGTAPGGITRLSGGQSHSSQDVYEYSLFFADLNAYDLGMVNRSAADTSHPAGYTDKGIVESHRWVDPPGRPGRPTSQPQGRGADGASPREHRSLRNVVDRHRQGVRHRVLWQNVRLPLVVPGKWGPTERGVRRSRARAWGEQFGGGGFDVVGMCELYSDKLLTRVKRGYDAFYPATDAEYGKQSLRDLGVLVGRREDDESRVSRRITHTESEAFDDAGPAVTSANREGWQRVVVEVPPLSGAPKFEVFVTHLQGVSGLSGGKKRNEDAKQRTKIAQLRELADEIAERNREKPRQPKILLGDFNVHSRGRGLHEDSGVEKGEYFSNFMHQMHAVGMQEAWLTYGGPGPDNSDCPHQDDEETCHPFQPRTAGYYQGNRLDYVFLEKPRPEHELRLDVSRLKMYAFDDHRWGKLSDHPGIGFELLTSPAN